MNVDRPQYGEYATPEEQRIRAGLPPLDQDAAVTPLASHAHPVTDAGGTDAVAPARPADRLITFVLLGFGLFNVLSSIPSFLGLSDTLNETMRMLGVEGEFSNFAAAKTWGVIALLVLMAGFAGTLWLSMRRMKRARSSWWIPLVGFVVTMLVVSACISVPMFGDPAFIHGVLTPPAG